MERYVLGDIIENPWAGHIDIKLGVYLGENKETYFILQNINGRWEKRMYCKTSTVNPQKWEKIGHTNMFDIGKEDLKKVKSKFNIRDDGTVIREE